MILRQSWKTVPAPIRMVAPMRMPVIMILQHNAEIIHVYIPAALTPRHAIIHFLPDAMMALASIRSIVQAFVGAYLYLMNVETAMTLMSKACRHRFLIWGLFKPGQFPKE
jgi:hypothetical protein